MKRLIPFAVLTLALTSPSSSLADIFKVDPGHTAVTFKVSHIFSRVSGRFDSFQGMIQFDEKNPGETKVEGVIQASTINTNNVKRDKHHRTKDFFYVEKYPTITFKSTKLVDYNPGKRTGKLHGILSMRGVDKEIVLEVAYLGTGKDPWGNVKAGFTATGTINRKDFGMVWNETLDSGGLFVGDEIEIEIDAEANAQ